MTYGGLAGSLVLRHTSLQSDIPVSELRIQWVRDAQTKLYSHVRLPTGESARQAGITPGQEERSPQAKGETK